MSGEVKLTKAQRRLLAETNAHSEGGYRVLGGALRGHTQNMAWKLVRAHLLRVEVVGRGAEEARFVITPSGLSVLQGGGKTNTVSVAESGSTDSPKSDSDGGH